MIYHSCTENWNYQLIYIFLLKSVIILFTIEIQCLK